LKLNLEHRTNGSIGPHRKKRQLPDPVETKLFLEGRDAWVSTWCLLNDKCSISSNGPVFLEVVAKLKREFHHYQKTA
jgi:hypothetical protein